MSFMFISNPPVIINEASVSLIAIEGTNLLIFIGNNKITISDTNVAMELLDRMSKDNINFLYLREEYIYAIQNRKEKMQNGNGQHG